MKCEKCGIDFLEKDIEESHDVPCYLFNGLDRREKKNKADKFPRHWLCKECHHKYEEGLRMSFKFVSMDFSNKFFGKKDE